MSLWTDIRDTVTAPVRAVTGLVGDIFSGQNVLESAGRFAAREFSSMTPGFKLATLPGVKQGLKALDPITFGVSGDLVTLGELNKKIDSGDKISRSMALEYSRTLGKDAAIIGAAYVGGAVLAPELGVTSTLGTVTTSAAGAGITDRLLRGDISGALTAAAKTVVPTEIRDAVQQTKEAISPFLPKGADPQPSVPSARAPDTLPPAAQTDEPSLLGPFSGGGSPGFSSQSGYSTGQKKGINPLLIAAVGVAAVVVVRRLRK